MRKRQWYWYDPKIRKKYDWRWIFYFFDWLRIEIYDKRLYIVTVAVYIIGDWFLRGRRKTWGEWVNFWSNFAKVNKMMYDRMMEERKKRKSGKKKKKKKTPPKKKQIFFHIKLFKFFLELK